MENTQTPTENSSPLHAAQGNLAFLLSVVRCGLDSAEEESVRKIIHSLGKEQQRIGELEEFKREYRNLSEELAEHLRAAKELLAEREAEIARLREAMGPVVKSLKSAEFTFYVDRQRAESAINKAEAALNTKA